MLPVACDEVLTHVGSLQERAGGTINEVLEKMPSNLIVPDSALTKSDHFSPYVRLLQQEVTLLNHLLKTMRTSMFELRRGLLGELQISSEMDQVMNALADDSVPRAWQAVSYPSLRSLGAWVADLGDRARFLRAWCAEPNQSLPKVTWLPGLFAPKSFLTAVQQFTALRNGWALDQTVVQAEVSLRRSWRYS
jgi:dynein heavy chain